MNAFPLLVPGAKETNETLEVVAPYDQKKIGSVATGDTQAVEQALATAHRLYQNRSEWLSPAQRISILEKTALLMKESAEELALEAAREGGKPLLDSRVEVNRAIDGIGSCIEELRTQTGHCVPMNLNPASANRIAMTTKEPIGVVVAASAFNHPVNLIVHQVGPAVTAGCPVIVKPASDTPLSCMRFVQILHQAGLPPEWCQALVTQKREDATRLITDDRVHFFSFIGSAEVGWKLRSQLAPGTRCALEHGGVAPVIVEADADLSEAIPLIAKGGLYHAGQVCVSVQRVYVQNSVIKDFTQQLVEKAETFKVGDPTAEETDVGPLIRPQEVDRVEKWVNEAVEKGAKLLTGGKRLSDTCYACTILLDPPVDSKVSCEEIFGPVICIYSYEKLEEAIEKANSLPVSFQSAVFTQNIDRAMQAYSGLDASAVMINDHTAFRVDWMPFAGLKHSGLGVGGIPHTLNDMQIEKLMILKSKSLR